MEADTASATLKALRRVFRAVEGGNRKLATATGLTPSQLLVLSEITAGNGITPSAVAQRLQFSQATITAVVDRLVALGFVTRTRSERDKRQFLLGATAEGMRELREAPDLLQETFVRRYAELAAWEQAMILAGVQRLASLLDAEAIDAAPLLDTGRIDRVTTKQR